MIDEYEDDEAKAARLKRVRHLVEDPREWNGVQIGQAWYSTKADRRGKLPVVPVYVSDLVHRGDSGRVVKLVDHTGKPRGWMPLHEFIASHERR